jgi:hypothetical protein
LKTKIISIVAAVALSATLFAVASTATGAYFSETKSSTINGTGGAVKLATSDMAINWDKMFPGVVYTANVDYRNDGDAPQDIWVVFNNPTALSALNSLGKYGAVRLSSTGGAYYYYNNLLDHPHDSVPHLLSQYKLADNLAVHAVGTMKFEFQYASQLGDVSIYGPASSGGPFPFNYYPAVYHGGPTKDLAIWNGVQTDQVTINAADLPAAGFGTGLPYQIVATQHGIEPGQVGTVAGF